MQIHEITQPPLHEGLLGNIGRGVASGLTGLDLPQSQASIDSNAAAAADKLRKQGYGQEIKLPTVQQAVAGVQKNPAQQKYIKGLVAQWQQQAPKAEPVATPAVSAQQDQQAGQQNKQPGQQDYKTTGANPGTFTQQTAAAPDDTRDPNWRQDILKKYGGVEFPQNEAKRSTKSKTKSDWRKDALKSVGAAFDPGPAARAKPGQMPASVAGSKQGKLMLKAYGKPRGGIQDIDEAPQEYYTNPGGKIVASRPLGSGTQSAPTTTTAEPTGNAYKDEFLKWAANNLKTDIPRVGTVTFDQIYKTDIKDELDRALAQVVATAGDAQKNAVAVNNFLTIAVAGVARESLRMKQDSGRGGEAGAVNSTQGGQAIVTQQELRNKLMSPELGLNTNQIDALKKQDPATKQALFKMLGAKI